jgi:isocitrate dehydrogenase
VLLSAAMMLNYLGWNEASDLLEKAIEKTIRAGKVTFDLAALMPGAQSLRTSEFGDALIKKHVS